MREEELACESIFVLNLGERKHKCMRGKGRDEELEVERNSLACDNTILCMTLINFIFTKMVRVNIYA